MFDSRAATYLNFKQNDTGQCPNGVLFLGKESNVTLAGPGEPPKVTLFVLFRVVSKNRPEMGA